MEKQASWWDKLTCGGQGLTPRDKKNQWVAAGWLFVWTVSCLVALAFLKRGAVPGVAATWTVALLPTALGVGVIAVYRRFLAQADELQRKLQLEAMAFGFGLGMVGSFAMMLIQQAGGPEFNVSDGVLPMIIGYVLAVIVGTRRYS